MSLLRVAQLRSKGIETRLALARIGQIQSHPRQPARTPPRLLTQPPPVQTGAEAQRPTARLRADWRGCRVWGRWGWVLCKQESATKNTQLRKHNY
jgi:hypothetical protein